MDLGGMVDTNRWMDLGGMVDTNRWMDLGGMVDTNRWRVDLGHHASLMSGCFSDM
jgi:hypothetical protein